MMKDILQYETDSDVSFDRRQSSALFEKPLDTINQALQLRYRIYPGTRKTIFPSCT